MIRRLSILLILFAANAAAEDDFYVASIPVDRSVSLGSLESDMIIMTLLSDRAQGIASAVEFFDGIAVVEASQDAITLALTPRPTRLAPPSDQHQSPSFVIDSDDDAVIALAKHAGIAPGIDDLTDLVFEHIDDKVYSRGFDRASRVAASGEGDCTEHAVLLAALARRFGYPAQLTFGVVLIEESHGVAAYGHAWTEIYDDGGWRLADATRLDGGDDAFNVRYIPLGGLDDEGLAYAMSMLEPITLFPSRISELRDRDHDGSE